MQWKVRLHSGRRVPALLSLALLTATVIAAPPPSGTGTGAAGGAASSAAGGGAAPTTPSAFFGQSSLNFAKPDSGWSNWSLLLPLPKKETQGDVYLCYEITRTEDATLPFILKSVTQFKVHGSLIPCYSSRAKNGRPLVRGDRLRIAIDASGEAATAFLENVSVINLNVVLTVAPPIQVALLRANLASTPTTTGLGGNSAPETDAFRKIGDDYHECIQEIQGYAEPHRDLPCSAIVALNDIAKREVLNSKALILPWPYTLPGDVIPTIYISALYTTPDNGKAWQPTTLYPAGSVVQCPAEDLCVADPGTPGQMHGGTQGVSGAAEPKWPGPRVVVDPEDVSPPGSPPPPGGGSVVWTPITASYWTHGSPAATPDGKPIYHVNDWIVWQSGQNSVSSRIDAWQPNTRYTANQSVIAVPADPSVGPQHLYAATKSGESGRNPPPPWAWTAPEVPDNKDQILWTYAEGKTDTTRPHQEGDIIVWASDQGKVQSIIKRWVRDTYYPPNSVILCPPNVLAPKLCVATGDGGTSGDTPPTSWQGSTVTDGNGKFAIVWKTGVAATLERWQPNTAYQLGAAVRCEQATQKNNLCVASVGGYSGKAEPWWAAPSASSSSGGSTSAAGTPVYQRDGQVLWTSAAPTATTAAPSANQVVNLGVQELTQVHAPSLWGLSTAVLYTTKRTPSAYSFAAAVPTGGCPVMATKTTAAMDCPGVSTAYQKNADIAFMVSPYVFHYLYSRFNPSAPGGIDAETRWAGRPEDFIPEPIFGFGVNSIGNTYYAGLSMELLVRNLQLIGGYGYLKAPYLTNPVTAAGSPANTVTPNTYMAWKGAPFVGLAFNISGLIAGH